MPRLIDADELINSLNNMFSVPESIAALFDPLNVERCIAKNELLDFLIKRIEQYSIIEAEPVVRSNWEYHCVGRFPRAPYHDIMLCPVCSYTHPKLTGYSYKRCMNCGAKMDGGTSDG